MILLLIVFYSRFFNVDEVFLVDFACYKPPETLKCSRDDIVQSARTYGVSDRTLDFITKTVYRAGIGDSTYLAKGLLRVPFNQEMDAAREESEMVMFGAVDALMAKTFVKREEIGILIVNCTVFNVVPSLSGIIVNRYKLREDVASFNLTGMGCATGLLAVGLAKRLLQVRKNTCALIVSTENVTCSLYAGDDRSKLLVNCIFRSGAAAVLLSNKPSHAKLSKYRLMHALHTHTASSDVAYGCISREEDSNGQTGVNINKDLLVAANLAIQLHLKSLGAHILPLSEQIRFLKNHIARRLSPAKIHPYMPKFNRSVEHFLPHVGGKPVLDELQRNLGFSAADMEPSRMTLHRFGNTSSSSVWYELAYAEAKGRVRKGDRVWQMAFGSGFKCNSAVWRALRDVRSDEKNPWMMEIDGYPVVIEENSDPFPFHFDSSKQALTN
ncbi:3-ketoacyl-CoA synthase 20-like [Andrographis paniculata]|uniref:3-ketoacyl-CoA synthase 20-like n=1 Tax=Andrographis paniculata TaxID=175694 RepID=UPI0021E7592C|nr:3-ketoacyl-CoA synthase 20-like [Andrographis paniculata]